MKGLTDYLKEKKKREKIDEILDEMIKKNPRFEFINDKDAISKLKKITKEDE